MLLVSSLFLTFLVSCYASVDDCTVNSYSELDEVIEKCNETIIIKNITVPAENTVTLALKDGVKLIIDGVILFDVYEEEFEGPLMKITGNKITVTGNPGSGLYGQGTAYWDGYGEWSGVKPKLLWIEATEATFTDIYVKNCPYYCVFIRNSSYLLLDGWILDNKDGNVYMSPHGQWGHNTDGFDVEISHDIEIRNSEVYNQDDCIAARMGYNMFFWNMYCHGGHGLSVSVGWDLENEELNTLRNVTFFNSTVVESENGIHVKTHNDAGKGRLVDLTYYKIRLEEITSYAINIQQDYSNGTGTGEPMDNIPIEHLVLDNVHGTTNSGATGIYIMCAQNACTDWEWKDVEITGQDGNKCLNSPGDYC